MQLVGDRMSNDTSHSEIDSLRRFPHYQPMVLCVLAVIAGIMLDFAFDWNFRFYVSIAVSSLIAWRVFRVDPDQAPSNVESDSEVRRENVASTLLLIGLIGIGGFWHHGRWNWFGANEIGLFAARIAQPCCLEALVISEPRWMAPNEQSGGLDYADETMSSRERFWFANANTRVRTSTVKRFGGFSSATFCSETRVSPAEGGKTPTAIQSETKVPSVFGW